MGAWRKENHCAGGQDGDDGGGDGQLERQGSGKERGRGHGGWTSEADFVELGGDVGGNRGVREVLER